MKNQSAVKNNFVKEERANLRGEGISQEQLDKAVAAALSRFAETQRLLALPYVRTEEAAMIYPIGKSTLEKMRADRSGPSFIQMGPKSPVLYSHDSIRKWLEQHRQKVM